MKTKLSAPFSEMKGKVGALVGQQRKSGQALVSLSLPYGVSGEERSEAQRDTAAMYQDAIQDWKTASGADLARWGQEAEKLMISAWNWLVKIEIDSRYDESEYDIGHYA